MADTAGSDERLVELMITLWAHPRWHTAWAALVARPERTGRDAVELLAIATVQTSRAGLTEHAESLAALAIAPARRTWCR